MGIFSRNKASTTSTAPAPVLPVPARNLASVLLNPHFTEKAIAHGEKGVYTFMVSKDATKYDVTDAIKAYYGVTPVKVNIVNKLPSTSMSRSKGRSVSEKGYKKAYVYLKAGDTITLV